DLTQTVPTEYHADLVVLLANDEPVLGIVLEVQLKPDERKTFTWPAYVVNLRARFQCPCCLLVVTPSRSTARWAAEPIGLGPPGNSFTPLVLGSTSVPKITDPARATQAPELAVLSALAHGQGDVETAIRIATCTLEAAAQLDEETRALYADLVEAALSEAARKALQMLPQNYQFQGPSYKKGKLEGKLEGQALGEADAVVTVLETRGLTLSPEQRDRILSCSDLETIKGWVRKAVTVESVDELFQD